MWDGCTQRLYIKYYQSGNLELMGKTTNNISIANQEDRPSSLINASQGLLGCNAM